MPRKAEEGDGVSGPQMRRLQLQLETHQWDKTMRLPLALLFLCVPGERGRARRGDNGVGQGWQWGREEMRRQAKRGGGEHGDTSPRQRGGVMDGKMIPTGEGILSAEEIGPLNHHCHHFEKREYCLRHHPRGGEQKTNRN